jgi:hypothetical protein
MKQENKWRVYLLGYNAVEFRWKSTDISEEYVASTSRVEEKAKQRTSVKSGGKHIHACF